MDASSTLYGLADAHSTNKPFILVPNYMSLEHSLINLIPEESLMTSEWNYVIALIDCV